MYSVGGLNHPHFKQTIFLPFQVLAEVHTTPLEIDCESRQAHAYIGGEVLAVGCSSILSEGCLEDRTLPPFVLAWLETVRV